MKQELKIKIKECVEERLPLEKWMLLLEQVRWSADCSTELSKEICDYLYDEFGYDDSTYTDAGGDYGSAIFRKEIIRDATPEEIRAVQYMQEYERQGRPYQMKIKIEIDIPGSEIEVNRITLPEAREILEGKEYFLELEKTND